jgi:hypothetical protein
MGSSMTGDCESFLVLELDTGRMDGWYNSQKSAEWCCETRKRRVGGRWVVVKLASAMGETLGLTAELTRLDDMEMDLR